MEQWANGIIKFFFQSWQPLILTGTGTGGAVTGTGGAVTGTGGAVCKGAIPSVEQ